MNIEKAQEAHLLTVEAHWRAASLLHSVAAREPINSWEVYEALNQISRVLSKAVEASYASGVGLPERPHD